MGAVAGRRGGEARAVVEDREEEAGRQGAAGGRSPGRGGAAAEASPGWNLESKISLSFDLAISILAVVAAAGEHTQAGRDGGVVEGVKGDLSIEQEREGCPMTGRGRGGSRRGDRDSKTPRDR